MYLFPIELYNNKYEKKRCEKGELEKGSFSLRNGTPLNPNHVGLTIVFLCQSYFVIYKSKD